MKCLSIQQPWASMVCSGVKDVENRSWRQKESPGRILIHAGAKRMYTHIEDMFMHERILCNNAISLGYIPRLEETPISAIIGYADVVGFVEDSDSDWAQSGDGAQWKWQLANAKLFKKPIPYKGKLGLFDVPEIDENNLPEVWDFSAIARDGETLTVPVAPKVFEEIKDFCNDPEFANEDYIFALNLTDSNLHLFADEELNPFITGQITFVNDLNGERMTKKVSAEQVESQIWDDTKEPILYKNYKGEELEWLQILYYIR